METILYGMECDKDVRGRFNIVQAAFLLLQSGQDDPTKHRLLSRLHGLLHSEVLATPQRLQTLLLLCALLCMFISLSSCLQ